MLLRIKRAIKPTFAAASTSTGKITCCEVPQPATGSEGNPALYKVRSSNHKNGIITNDGTEYKASITVIMEVSRQVFCQSDASTPAGTPITRLKINASIPNSSETGTPFAIKSQTGRSGYLNE